MVILNPGLTPWAFLLDPFRVLSFAPETNEARGRHWHAASLSGGQGNQVHSSIIIFHFPFIIDHFSLIIPQASFVGEGIVEL